MVGFSSPRGGVCEKAKDMETDVEDVEEPSFGPPHHGEHCDIVPKPKEPPAFVCNDLEMAMETDYDDVQEPGAVPKRKKVPKKKKRPHGAVPKRKRAKGGISLEVCNDLQAAIEVNPGTGWRVMYPEERFCLDTFQPIDVATRLRDDPDICGTCCVGATALLRATEAFGNSFGPAAVEFMKAEQREVEHERQLQEARLQKKIDAIDHADCDGNGRMCVLGMILLFPVCCFFLGLVLDILLKEGGFTSEEGRGRVGFAIGVFCASACGNWVCLWSRKNQAAAEVKLLGGEIGCYRHTVRLSCTVSVLLTLGFGFLTVVCCITSPWFALIFGPAWLCWCCLFRFCYLMTHDRYSTAHDGEETVKMACEKSIVFNGRVLDSPPSLRCPECVVSWPGKYESAWERLVESSRDRGLSAAVVFLPEGSEHFGSHDPIPDEEALEGECWCIPLYGEKKPWGCRWWTLWIANIEKAVEYGAELKVFFFEKKKGQGKVQSFATAGQESLRRDAIWQRKAEFEESVEFQNAKAAGLHKLSKCKRLDSSSQYTREWQRLFLAWLPEDDRKFLEASEGLGNSQKAEVAWLERKGYPYQEVEVDAAAWTRFQASPPSPKVIGVAAEP